MNSQKPGLITLILVLALVVSSCGGSSEDLSATVDSPGDAVGEDAPVEEDGVTEDGVDTPETTATTEAPTSEEALAEESEGGGDCIVGDWAIQQQEMQGFYDALSTNATGSDVTFIIEGNTLMSFGSDGSLHYIPDFNLVLDTGGLSGEGTAGGQLSGTYTVEDGIITTEVTESGLTLEVTVAGITMDQDTFGDLFSSIPINSAPYHCTDEGPAIEFETGGAATHLVQLTPA